MERAISKDNIRTVSIEDEVKRSYLEYSMSVIVGRALPDIRDGLKPVHRRILYSMYELRNFPDRPYKKSARVVGDVIGKYHPHGDAPVYDAIVRMAQDFSMRYPLVDGQGNFGSIDGDPPAAMRYTEVRMTPMAKDFLSDIEKETVDFTPNYDGSLMEPVVLPTTIPNLLINGSSGIAVGMATNIPPHNIGEVCDAVIKLIDEPETGIDELIRIIPGPDFPTAGFITGREGIKEAYQTGKGIIRIRANAFIEEGKKRDRIIISEIPYQVNKTKLLERIGELVRDKKIEGISDIRDESNKEGIRIVIELKKDANSRVIMNRLYKFTQMEISFGIIFLAIVNGRPETLNLKEIIEQFILHRREVIRRRTLYDLKKAEQRAHILEGLRKALAALDKVIKLIRGSSDPKEAKSRLIEELDLTPAQAQAILDMTLQRLTGLEREKIEKEYQQLIKDIAKYKEILSNPRLILEIIKEETEKIKERYGDPRRTRILDEEGRDIEAEDLIANEEMVVTISHRGYIKRTPVSLYRAQRRGGKGLIGAKARGEDFIEHIFLALSHDMLLFFTNMGRVYCKKVYEIPEGGRASRGKAIINLLNLRQAERIAHVLPVREFSEKRYLVMATSNGIVKKSRLSLYSRIRSDGLQAVKIREGDNLIGVQVIEGDEEILLSTRYGKSIRFSSREINETGRMSSGVIGIRMEQGDRVVSMETVKADEEGYILTVTENGYGKRTRLKEYRAQGRGGRGILTVKTKDKNGALVYSGYVKDGDQIMIITDQGKIIRINVKDISIMGRNTQGVRLIQVNGGEKVVDVAKVVEED
ncbi:MAG: DNA gyrase subunit A [Deltaproteobacteria bacterium]|nr:MAG: DNA gyrase subunit A [Deltaproteobacteria bacterium]